MHFALDEQIASQPGAVRTLLGRIVVPKLDASRPVVLTGIGTSLHACRIAGWWLTELSQGEIRPVVVNAHDLALWWPLRAEDQVIVVTHRGTKRFPREARERARQLGAKTVVITCEDAAEPEADAVIRTCPNERAGAHTVSYITALVALGEIVANMLGERGKTLKRALGEVADAIEETLRLPAPVEQAQRLAGREPILITGVGVDAITADEAALKIKEGTYQWAEGLETELALHGPPAAFRAGMGAITITPAEDDGGRTEGLREELKIIGAEALTCGETNEDLRFVRVERLIRPLVSVVPLQRLVAELARLVGSDPDMIHKREEPWKTMMDRVVL